MFPDWFVVDLSGEAGQRAGVAWFRSKYNLGSTIPRSGVVAQRPGKKKIAGEVAGARGSEWLGEAFAPATLPAMHTVLREFRRSETKLERGRGCNSLRSQQQSALERVSPVVETGVNTLFVDAGASPAGFSRAVVQPRRTTDPYTLVNCSP